MYGIIFLVFAAILFLAIKIIGQIYCFLIRLINPSLKKRAITIFYILFLILLIILIISFPVLLIPILFVWLIIAGYLAWLTRYEI